MQSMVSVEDGKLQLYNLPSQIEELGGILEKTILL